MPKIIDEVRNSILSEAKQLLQSEGYSKMTLRAVAERCGIAVGTIYNHFQSKDMLIAAFMLDDWNEVLSRLRSECCTPDADPTDSLHCVYREIVEFSEKYESLFGDAEARRSAGDRFPARHILMRSQISGIIAGTCQSHAKHFTPFLPDFLAGSVLSHAMERRDFRELAEILEQLFK